MKKLRTASRLLALGCAALIGLWNTSQAFAADDDEPAITVKTSYYEWSGTDNVFSFCMDVNEPIYVVVDCGFGPVEYELEPSQDGTWIPCIVDQKGTVLMYTDKPEVINYVYCQGGHITEIDLSKLTGLEFLDLSNNDLKKIDLSNNVKLQTIDLGTNPFDAEPLSFCPLPHLQLLEIENVKNLSPDFDLTSFPELKSFAAFSTKSLYHIDTSRCPKLQRITVSVTGISELDVTNNPELLILDIADSFITSIDLSKNSKLVQLYAGHQGSYASDYKFSTLDVTNNPELVYLFAQENNLKTIDITKNPKLQDVQLTGNYLESFDCSANPYLSRLSIRKNCLDFATLPLGKEFSDYYYDQRPMPVSLSFPVGSQLDLSKRVLRDGTVTEMSLYSVSSSDIRNPVLLSKDFYDYEDGVIKFKKECNDSVYASFTNLDFPDCVLTTTKFMVKSEAQYGKPVCVLDFSTTLAPGSDVAFGLGVGSANPESPRTVFVDFGDGVQVPVEISCQVPDAPNVNGKIAGTGGIKVYVNDGDNLSGLSIDGYTLYNIDLEKVPTLRSLSLTGTGLSYIDLSWQRCLENLTLTGNKFGTLDLTSDIPGYDKNVLRKLDLSDNQLYDLTYNAERAIKEINLSHNQLSSLAIEQAYNLKKLDVSFNEFTSLAIANLDSLQTLIATSNHLTEVQIPWQETLENLDCRDNDLSFASLPYRPGELKGEYLYAPQRDITISRRGPGFNLKKVGLDVDGVPTVFRVHKEDGSLLTEGVDYTIKDGSVRFVDYSLGQVYCSMTNEVYPELTMTTSMMLVSEPPTNLLGWMDVADTLSDTQGYLSLAAAKDGESLYVNWDGEGKDYAEYTLATTYTVFPVEPIPGRRAYFYGYEEPEFLTVFSANNIPAKKADFSAMRGLNLFTMNNAGCSDIVLPDIDNLESLGLDGNGITSIDPTRLQKLTYLAADYNNIKTFDLSQFPMLKVVALRNNGLTDIKFDNKDLWFLSLANNNLEEINLEGLPSLDVADFAYNKLKKIDVNGPKALGELYIVGNCLDFQTLPLDKESYRVYYYGDQAHVSAICDGMTVDLSSQVERDGVATSFYWCQDEPYFDSETGELYAETLVPNVDYTINEGVTTFNQEFANVCCLMMNELFPSTFLLTDLLNIKSNGVDAAVAKAVAISVDGRVLTISAEDGTQYAVYSTDGKTVATGSVAVGSATVELPAAGIYVVKAGKASMKLSVK